VRIAIVARHECATDDDAYGTRFVIEFPVAEAA